MDKFNNAHAKVLYLRFSIIYARKFVESYHDDDFKSLWENEWAAGLENVNLNSISPALEYCRNNCEWPPSIAEFIKICDSYSGVPSVGDCLKACINRVFAHPLALMCYQKVGSWAITHDNEKELESKFQKAYTENLIKFREAQETSWELLENYNAKPKELPAPSKIPSTSESKAFRECMNKCQEILQGKKIIGGGKTYKEFPANQIKPGHREFDQAVFDEYREYLMGIPETETMILPPVYLLERNKFLNMRDQAAFLNSQGYIPPNQREPMNEPPRNGRTQKVYTSWTND